MELTICERWTQYAQPPSGDQPWWLDWAVRAPKDAGVHLTAGLNAYRAAYEAMEFVRRPFIAMEYFGGVGGQTMMIQDLFEPDRHRVVDYSREAVQHIATNVPQVNTLVADSYDPDTYMEADLVGLDFGDLTVWKTREGEKHRTLLDRVFAGEPGAVVLTDIACPYLHLHRQRYETLLGEGTCATYPDYLRALADRLEGLYGYRMVGGFYHRWSTVMALAPDGPRAEFVPTPRSPLGLEIVG